MNARHVITKRVGGKTVPGTVVLGVLLLAPSVWGQVSINVLHDGADTLTVDPGEVSLALDFQVTSGVSLNGLQWALIASDADLFVYDDPSRVIGTPFTGGDAFTGPPTAGSSLADEPTLLFFKMTEGDYPADQFPSVVMTLNVRSVNALPDGTYTFVAGDNGQGFYWTGNATNGTFDTAGMFTLIVGTGGDTGDTSGGGIPGDDGGTVDDGDTGDDGGTVDDGGTGDDGGGDTGDDGSGGTDGGDAGDDTGADDGDSGVVTPDPGTDPSTGDGDIGGGDSPDDTGSEDDGSNSGGDADDGTGGSGPVVPPSCGGGLVETATVALSMMLLMAGHRRRRFAA